MTAGDPAVAIAVVNTNMSRLLVPCLRSMHPDVESGLAEVWVVDSASKECSPAIVRRDFPWANLIASESNLGYGRAVNMVAERTSTPWVAPANEDIELRPGALGHLLLTGEEHPEAAVVAPRLELPDGSTQHTAYPFPTLPFAILFNLGLHRFDRRLADRLCLEGYWDPGKPREVPWAIATFMIVRRVAFEGVGGFSRDQFMYSDDLDLGWRLHRAGWTTRHEPEATVFHVGHAASTQAFGPDLRTRWMAASYSWMARQRGLAIARAVAIVNIAGAGARWAVFSVLARLAPRRFGHLPREYRAWIRAHRTGLRPRADLLREH